MAKATLAAEVTATMIEGANAATRVYYSSYGSNLCIDRLMCYIAGGRLPTMKASLPDYPGARDVTPPAISRQYTLPFPMYFARESKAWGGGVCFVDYTRTGRTKSRAHLVTLAQFNDIVVQENGGDTSMRLSSEQFVDLIAQKPGSHLTLRPKGWYGTVIYCGHIENNPVLSFSCCQDHLTRYFNPPKRPYLGVLMRGLAEMEVEAKESVTYLASRCCNAGMVADRSPSKEEAKEEGDQNDVISLTSASATTTTTREMKVVSEAAAGKPLALLCDIAAETHGVTLDFSADDIQEALLEASRGYNAP